MVNTIATATKVTAVDASSFGIAVFIGLIILLVIKELCVATENPKFIPLSLKLNIVIVPLLIVFCFTFIAAIY